MKRIYLDHTATTPLDPRVFESMKPFFSDTFGNASSIHSFGRQARTALEHARDLIANAIGARPREVFFTSGGTESDNFAIQGAARAAATRGRNHIVVPATEHHAVLEPCGHLAGEGFQVTFLPVDENGAVRPEDLQHAVTPSTGVVSVMHANNEVGTINPVREAAAIAHGAGAVFHTDAVQTLGKIPLNVEDLGVDLLSVSAHKIYGPKGIGALYIRTGITIDQLFYGGGQERGRRPGTENVAMAVGFAKAVEIAAAEMESESCRLRSLRDRLEAEIRAMFPSVIVNGDPARRLPHILNISFDHRSAPMEGDMLVVNMDLKGVAVTSGSACTSGSMQPSHVLRAMGRDAQTAKATLRFSLGRGNSEEDVSSALQALKEVVEMMNPSARAPAAP